jgi:hypothetical protein
MGSLPTPDRSTVALPDTAEWKKVTRMTTRPLDYLCGAVKMAQTHAVATGGPESDATRQTWEE